MAIITTLTEIVNGINNVYDGITATLIQGRLYPVVNIVIHDTEITIAYRHDNLDVIKSTNPYMDVFTITDINSIFAIVDYYGGL
jgi:hypothetical protein